MPDLYPSARAAALAILARDEPGLSWKGAQFLGQIAGLPGHVLTEKQREWLGQIFDRAGVSLEGGAE